MVAIVVLTPEEVELVREGKVAEPNFRPDPRFDVHQHEDFDEDPDSGGRDSLATLVPTLLDRIGAAKHWRRSSVERALIFSREGQLERLIAVGDVRAGPRIKSKPGTRRIEIRVYEVLGNPIGVAELLERLKARQRHQLTRQLNGPVRPLSKELLNALLRVLRDSMSAVAEALDRIDGATEEEILDRVDARDDSTLTLVRDTTTTSLSIFTRRWRRLDPVPSPEPSAFAERISALVGNENDFITDDSAVFPGWDRSEHSVRGWWEFRDQERSLFIKNINASPQESRTGADLIYVRRQPSAVVLVQYKLLESLADGRLIYRPDDRLGRQVERMLSLERMPPGDAVGERGEDYRLGSGFTFVKFVNPDEESRNPATDLTPGFYLPSELARRVLKVPGRGPQGGSVHYIAESRSLTPAHFADLVRDGWVGSTGEVTNHLTEIVGLRDREAQLLIAVEDQVKR